MDKKKTQQEYTQNKFKNGDCPDKCQFSQKWVELINRQEKARAAKRQTRRALCGIICMQRFVLS